MFGIPEAKRCRNPGVGFWNQEHWYHHQRLAAFLRENSLRAMNNREGLATSKNAAQLPLCSLGLEASQLGTDAAKKARDKVLLKAKTVYKHNSKFVSNIHMEFLKRPKMRTSEAMKAFSALEGWIAQAVEILEEEALVILFHKLFLDRKKNFRRRFCLQVLFGERASVRVRFLRRVFRKGFRACFRPVIGSGGGSESLKFGFFLCCFPRLFFLVFSFRAGHAMQNEESPPITFRKSQASSSSKISSRREKQRQCDCRPSSLTPRK